MLRDLIMKEGEREKRGGCDGKRDIIVVFDLCVCWGRKMIQGIALQSGTDINRYRFANSEGSSEMKKKKPRD